MSVYTWGLGASGQLGTGLKTTEHCPKKVRYLGQSKKKCKSVACGGLFTAILTEEGKCLTTGCGKNGRLGSNNDDKDKLGFKEILQQVKQVSAGIWHGAAVKMDDSLVVWGNGRACGTRDKSVSIPPTIVPCIKVTGVSCGFNFTLAWTADGQAYSFGSGPSGELGLGPKLYVDSPTLIEGLKDYKVSTMSAGYSHSGAITEDRKIFMFGKGKDGALGFGSDIKNVFTPKQLTEYSHNVLFRRLSCSVGEHHGHTLASTTDGRVYSWGDGYKGKLGCGDQTNKSVPTQIPKDAFGGEFITDVAAGGIHSAAISQEGHVYTWGCGSDGRLGHPEGKGHRYLFRSDVPKLVEKLLKFKALKVACSYYHTVAIVDDL